MERQQVVPAAAVRVLVLEVVRERLTVVDKLQRRVRVLQAVPGRAGPVVWAVRVDQVQVDRVQGEDLREAICRRCCPGFLRGLWLI